MKNLNIYLRHSLKLSQSENIIERLKLTKDSKLQPIKLNEQLFNKIWDLLYQQIFASYEKYYDNIKDFIKSWMYEYNINWENPICVERWIEQNEIQKLKKQITYDDNMKFDSEASNMWFFSSKNVIGFTRKIGDDYASNDNEKNKIYLIEVFNEEY